MRVRFVVPNRGLGRRLNHLHEWLADEVGTGDFTVHASSGIHVDTVAIYLRDIEGTQAMVDTFPYLVFADGTGSIAFGGPVHDAAWQGAHLFSLCSLHSMTRTQDAIRQLAKAMTAEEEFDTWLSADIGEALKLQRPLPDGSLRIVAEGTKSDEVVAA